ncbi:PIN domain-containing protein [Pseudomonas koreensis]
MELMLSYQGRPVILDTYAAKIAVELGILDGMIAFFSNVIVAQSAIQTLQLLAVDKAGFLNISTSGHPDVLNAIKQIQEKCEIVEYIFSRSSDELTEKLIEINASGIAPYFIATDREALFISEDLYSREFSANLFKVVDSIWLQIVANVLLQQGLITKELYCRAILSLAERKHNFLSVGSMVLEQTYQSDTTAELSQFSAICEFLGGASAELESHYQLIYQFLLMRWVIDYNRNYDLALENMLLLSHGDAFPSSKAMKATSILLNKLISIPGGQQKLYELMDLPVLRLKNFIIGWWQGHFYKE